MLLPLRIQRMTSWSYLCSFGVRSPMISLAREMYCFRISKLFLFVSIHGRISLSLRKGAIVRWCRIRPSLPVQLNHIRRRVVTTLRAINAAQQSGSDVPVLTAFSDNCNGLFVVAREHANLKRPTFRLKRNPIANTELQHLGVSAHVPQEFQPLDNPIVEINQFTFSKPVNVDPHDSSRSHRYGKSNARTMSPLKFSSASSRSISGPHARPWVSRRARISLKSLCCLSIRCRTSSAFCSRRVKYSLTSFGWRK